MTTQQINNGLQTILTNAGISAISFDNDVHFSNDLGLDSLDLIDLILEVEIYFGIRIPDEDWWMLQTLNQLKVYLTDELTFAHSPIHETS